MGAVGRDGGKQPIRTRIPMSSRSNGQGGVGIIAAARSEPFHDLACCPGLRTIRVAGRANIRRADRRCHIRAWNAESVIPAPIHAHIGHGRHVAGYALRASTARRMPMMFCHIKACR